MRAFTSSRVTGAKNVEKAAGVDGMRSCNEARSRRERQPRGGEWTNKHTHTHTLIVYNCTLDLNKYCNVHHSMSECAWGSEVRETTKASEDEWTRSSAPAYSECIFHGARLMKAWVQSGAVYRTPQSPNSAWGKHLSARGSAGVRTLDAGLASILRAYSWQEKAVSPSQTTEAWWHYCALVFVCSELRCWLRRQRARVSYLNEVRAPRANTPGTLREKHRSKPERVPECGSKRDRVGYWSGGRTSLRAGHTSASWVQRDSDMWHDQTESVSWGWTEYHSKGEKQESDSEMPLTWQLTRTPPCAAADWNYESGREWQRGMALREPSRGHRVHNDKCSTGSKMDGRVLSWEGV